MFGNFLLSKIIYKVKHRKLSTALKSRIFFAFATCTIKFTINSVHALHIRVTYCEEVEMDRRNLRMTRNESSTLADSQARWVTSIDQQQSYIAITVLSQREAIFRTIVCVKEAVETTVLLPQTMSDA